MADSKKLSFSIPPILNIFFQKFNGLVLGLVVLMPRALMLLNLYGCEAVQHKLKNCLKTQKMYFLPVFELMSDSLMTIQVG
jgi:hypothetical protein